MNVIKFCPICYACAADVQRFNFDDGDEDDDNDNDGVFFSMLFFQLSMSARSELL